MFENIWEDKKNMDEDTKVSQVAITFRNHALDWFMILVVNIPQGSPKSITDARKTLDNKFQQPSSEDQYMNDMIEIK
jgi:hypothetical protein